MKGRGHQPYSGFGESGLGLVGWLLLEKAFVFGCRFPFQGLRFKVQVLGFGRIGLRGLELVHVQCRTPEKSTRVITLRKGPSLPLHYVLQVGLRLSRKIHASHAKSYPLKARMQITARFFSARLRNRPRPPKVGFLLSCSP